MAEQCRRTLSVDFQVELVCEELKSTQVVSLSLPTFPTTFKEVKDAIEKSFSVPSYLQTLWVHGVKIDSQSDGGMAPSQYYLQAGDTIKVSFPMKCDCEKVKKITKWLSECLDIVHSLQSAISEEEVKKLYYISSRTLLDYSSRRCLVDELFLPWGDKMKLTSAWYFDHLGGVTSLVKMHKAVQSLSIRGSFKPLHSFCYHFETVCCNAFVNFVADTALRRRATECGALDCSLNSFLGVTADNLQSTHIIKDSLMAICK